ncbi:hypothetical protein BGX34_006517 [Mortierella sp. NVP85]|nr:hypothetical protein BGX34_006517 [Mortierella sp. NVP85]
MTAQPHPFFDPAQAENFKNLAAKTDSHFEVKYFGFHGLGAAARTILAAANAKFTNVTPTDFSQEKPLVPFGLLPLLKETSADGKITIQISESDAIERYLSRKFGFSGDDIFEETVINQFVSNSAGITQQIFGRYVTLKEKAEKEAARAKLIEGPLKDWAVNHEKHLVANGSNGHYVGNKTTFADIKAMSLIWLIQVITGDAVISSEKTPSILKVKDTLEDLPGMRAWYATEEYKAYDVATRGFFSA